MSHPALPPEAGRRDARLRLFTLPFAGGGVGVYARWQEAMPEGVEVIALRLAGRESRLREPASARMEGVLADLLPAITPLLDRPWALFGHSMGGAIAWELARRTQDGPIPATHLFISSRRAPGRPLPHPPMFALPEAPLIEAIEARYGPFPATLRGKPSLLRTFLPTLRADLAVIDTWQPPACPLHLPITVFAAQGDAMADPAELQAWQHAGDAGVDVREVPGSHFHVREHTVARDHVAKVLAQHLV